MSTRKTKTTTSPDAPTWMMYEQAAAYLGVSERRSWVPTGKVPYTKLGGNRVLFQAWQLDAFLQASSHMPEGM